MRLHTPEGSVMVRAELNEDEGTTVRVQRRRRMSIWLCVMRQPAPENRDNASNEHSRSGPGAVNHRIVVSRPAVIGDTATPPQGMSPNVYNIYQQLVDKVLKMDDWVKLADR